MHTYTQTHILLQYVQENEIELTEDEKRTRFKMTGKIVIAYLTVL